MISLVALEQPGELRLEENMIDRLLIARLELDPQAMSYVPLPLGFFSGAYPTIEMISIISLSSHHCLQGKQPLNI